MFKYALMIIMITVTVNARNFNIIPVLQRLEGCELTAYKDLGGDYHVGFGTPSYAGERITRKEAVKRAVDHINRIKQTLNETVEPDLSHNQQVALISFIYNIGEYHWKHSTVRKVINKKRFDLVPWAMSMWNKITINGHKRVCPGLIKRRQYEIRIWSDNYQNVN